MKDELVLVKLDYDYCNYLRQFDNKVPFNYQKKINRPFIGVLFNVDNFMYFAPLSSPKQKHLKLKAKLDFLKIDGGKMGAINFNNMLPVMDNNIIPIDLNKRCFTSDEKKYFKLLNSQIFWLNRHKDKICGRSKKLYDKYVDRSLDKKIADRCCNFKMLEEKCLEYNK